MRSLRYFIVLTAALGMLAIANVQAQQRMVLWEEFTQWNCPPCGQANPGIETLLGQNWNKVIHIWYHGQGPDADDDPMDHWDVTDHINRFNYYGVQYEPTGVFDGQLYSHNGYVGNPQDTAYDDQLLSNAETISTPVSIAITETPDGNGGAGVHIVVSSTQALSGNYMLRVAVVKSEVDSAKVPTANNPYRNPEVEFPNVVQKMLPDYNGSAVSIANAGGQQTFDFTYAGTDIMPTGNASRVFIVAWVQDEGSKKVVNTSSDYFQTTVTQAPSILTAAPGVTNSYTASVKNSSSSPLTVISTLSSVSAPHSWQVSYTANGQTYSGTDTLVVAAGSTAKYSVNFAMTGGKGIGNANFDLQEISGDTSYITKNSFYSASSDVNTVIADGSGDPGRPAACATTLNAAITATNNKYNTIYGNIPSLLLSNLLSESDSIRTVIYVAGATQTDGVGPSPNDATALTSFTQNGGNVLMTGAVMAAVGATYASQYGVTYINNFLNNVMHVKWVTETTTMTYNVVGYTNDTISNGVSTGIISIGQNTNVGLQFYPDVIAPFDVSAKPVLKYSGSNFQSDSVCGVRYQKFGTGGYKSVFLSVPFEAMQNSSASSTLMKNIIAWFNATPAGANAVNEPIGTPATDFQLVQNYPNPFAGTTDIRFTLPQDENVTLNVYDMKGSLVATVANSLFHAGANSVTFDGSNLSTGIYEYRLTTPSGTLTHLMSLVRQ